MPTAKILTALLLAAISQLQLLAGYALATSTDAYIRGRLLADSNKNSTDSDIELADGLLDEKKYGEAIKKYRSVLNAQDINTQNTSLIHIYRKIGIAFTLTNKYDQAIESFESALKVSGQDPDSKETLEVVATQYSLARALESKGDFEEALTTCQKGIVLAQSKLTDSPTLIRRLQALKAELYLGHVAQKLNPEKVQEKTEHPDQFSTIKPLIGGVTSSDYFKAPALISEVPSLAGMKSQTVLASKTNKTELFTGTKKVKNKLVQKLMEYGTMGLSLQKDLPGFPWYVKHVLDGGAAQRYGAQKGDILNSIDGHPIVTTPIATIYHMLCGRRGEVRTLGINRGGKDMFLRVQLISVYEIGNGPSEYIEYYWFLLYNGYITNGQYAKLSKPYERYLH